MKSIKVYKRINGCLEQAEGNFYAEKDIEKCFENISKKSIKSNSKIYFLDDKFPKRMLSKAGLKSCKDINEADHIIMVNKYELLSVSWGYLACIHDLILRQWWHPDDIPDAVRVRKIPSYFAKYLEVLDNPKAITRDKLYCYCRKFLPELTNEELDSCREMLNSSDQDVARIAALMVSKSNNNDLKQKAKQELYSKRGTTKELNMFLDYV